MAKYTAMDIANFFVQLSIDLPETEITNLKLNKLCYYAQAWSITKLGYPLFDEKIEAWKYGPVVPSVYHRYKVCGNHPIAEPADEFDEKRLTIDELDLLTDVFSTYGKYEPGQLMLMTHVEGGPWDKVYEEGKNREISQKSMEEYFENSNELDTMQLNVTPENVVTYA